MGKVESAFISIMVNNRNYSSQLQYRILEFIKQMEIIANNTYFIDDVPYLNFNPHHFIAIYSSLYTHKYFVIVFLIIVYIY